MLQRFFSKQEIHVDPVFDEANKQFQIMKKDYKNLNNAMLEMDKQLKNLSTNVTLLCENTNSWNADAPRKFKQLSTNMVKFSRTFDFNVYGVFGPELQEKVITPLKLYEANIEEIENISEKRSKSLRQYEASIQRGKKESRVDLELYKSTYEEYHTKFVTKVNDMRVNAKKILNAVYQAFLIIYCDFMSNLMENISPLENIIPIEEVIKAEPQTFEEINPFQR